MLTIKSLSNQSEPCHDDVVLELIVELMPCMLYYKEMRVNKKVIFQLALYNSLHWDHKNIITRFGSSLIMAAALQSLNEPKKVALFYV